MHFPGTSSSCKRNLALSCCLLLLLCCNSYMYSKPLLWDPFNKKDKIDNERRRVDYGISGVLVRLTTCKRLTNSLPKLSLINTLLP